jgi:hypothetical protein
MGPRKAYVDCRLAVGYAPDGAGGRGANMAHLSGEYFIQGNFELSNLGLDWAGNAVPKLMPFPIQCRSEKARARKRTRIN